MISTRNFISVNCGKMSTIRCSNQCLSYVLMLSMLLSILIVSTTVAQESYVSTIAGGGVCDGYLATQASLAYPGSPTIGPDGSIYIADTTNHRVRQVYPNGTITTIAGTGISGYNGDGIPATRAHLKNPVSVAVNSIGEVFISDNGNNRIRKVLTNGTIITFAGSAQTSFSGDYGLAINAGINYPYGIALNSIEELIISDVNHNRIRKVLTNGTIYTIAGTNIQGYNGDNKLATSASLFLSFGVSVDANDNVYIADTDNDRIRKVLTNGTIYTIAGIGNSGFSGDGGLATAAKISSPEGVSVSPEGEVYFAGL